MSSTKSASFRLVLAGIGGVSALSLIGFMFTIGGGKPTGPGILLASAVASLGTVAYLLFQSARALVSTGTAAEEREAQAAVGRRRKELEREYFVLKRALKELELDYAMGKLSEQDYSEIRTRYRERAVRILRQLDQGESYRAQIERDLEARRTARGGKRRDASASSPSPSPAAAPAAPAATSSQAGTCAKCGARNDNDAVFCKKCGARLS